MILLIEGPQASGKGTQAELLEKQYNIKHVSIGELLRDEERKNTKRGRLIKNLIDKGDLVPNSITNEMAAAALKKYNKLIFDGYPRNLNQAKFLDETVKIDLLIFLDVPRELSIQRISNRRECKTCGEVYNLVTKQPKKRGICHCGGALYQRPDDIPTAINKRLRIYHKATEPVIDYFKDKTVLIDGSKPIKDGFNDIVKALKDNKLI